MKITKERNEKFLNPTSHRVRISASEVDTFYGCRRLFKYRYLRPPFVVPKNKYFLLGSLVHYTLEAFHTMQLGYKPVLSPKDLMRVAYRYARTRIKVSDGSDIKILEKRDFAAAKLMLIGYLCYIKENPPTINRIELRQTVIEDGIEISGVMDRLDTCDGAPLIIDYKTNKRKGLNLADSVQLQTYAFFMHKLGVAAGDPVNCQYLYLASLPSKNAVQTVSVTPENVQEALDRYKRMRDELNKKNCSFTRNRAYKYCFYCDYRSLCFEDHNDLL